MLERDRGSSLRQIAIQLDRSPATLSREIRRNATLKRYCATLAGKAYASRRRRCVKPRKLTANKELRDQVQSDLLNRKWSPEQIAATLKMDFQEQPAMHVSPETIYAHIYAYPRGEYRKMLTQALRRNKSKRGPRGSGNSNYSSLKIRPEQVIASRPASINSREIIM